jgi:hypothetical protein
MGSGEWGVERKIFMSSLFAGLMVSAGKYSTVIQKYFEIDPGG